jgi:two-component system, response regulator PdtaR
LGFEIVGKTIVPVGPLTILVVEDEAFVAMDATAILEEAGHEVCGIAADKVGALRLAERFRPDAAVVDLHLTNGRTGLEVSRELWERHGTVCVLTTAYPPETWPKGRHGARGLLGKPYQADDLLAALAYCFALAEGGSSPDDKPSRLKMLE